MIFDFLKIKNILPPMIFLIFLLFIFPASLDFKAKKVSSIVRERIKIYLYASEIIIRNVSETPIILKDFIIDEKGVVKTISKEKETEFRTLRKTSSTT